MSSFWSGRCQARPLPRRVDSIYESLKKKQQRITKQFQICAGIHLESAGAKANLVLPRLSVLAARWRPSVRPFISVRLLLFDESVRRACRLDQLSSPYLSYFTIVHYSWDVRAPVEHRNVSLTPPPLPPHFILTLKEKRRRPKGRSTRTRSVRRGERASPEKS